MGVLNATGRPLARGGRGANGAGRGGGRDRGMDLAQQRELVLRGRMYDDLTPELLAARETVVVAAAAYNDSFGRHAEERLRLLCLLRGARRPQCALRADAARGVRLQHLCGR
ncbi:maltose acetyltransferase domain-containing protein [Kocuria palustris]|uniref:maltose acetyltransferase domain-containing protein n=2 Tax=Kocuria palustris TaxID=71999 RepID=UPI003B96912B